MLILVCRNCSLPPPPPPPAESALGGPARVAELTGSRAYERFTGNQIAKVASGSPAAYAATERVSLISSMMCSLLLGDYAPIDHADGCGMNLLDLRSKQWSAPVLGALPAAKDLAAKLGAPAPSHAVAGSIAPYFTSVYGFPSSASVVAWSGDNPCSVAGLGLRAPGDIAVSLGTSDTMFGILAQPSPGVEGHIFANPVDPASYMAMLCYKNVSGRLATGYSQADLAFSSPGHFFPLYSKCLLCTAPYPSHLLAPQGSLCREGVRNAVAGSSWDAFNALLAASPAGNNGNLGFFFESPEITPTVLKAGTRRFAKGPNGKYARVSAFAQPSADARAVVEGQFMSMRLHGESIGMVNPTRLIATGGASSNAAVLQVLSDVFGAPVYVASQTDSASLGAAYRAAHGWVVQQRKAFVPFETVLQAGAGPAASGASGAGGAGPIALTLAASPRAEATKVYTAMLPEYAACEAQVTGENQ